MCILAESSAFAMTLYAVPVRSRRDRFSASIKANLEIFLAAENIIRRFAVDKVDPDQTGLARFAVYRTAHSARCVSSILQGGIETSFE